MMQVNQSWEIAIRINNIEGPYMKIAKYIVCISDLDRFKQDIADDDFFIHFTWKVFICTNCIMLLWVLYCWIILQVKNKKNSKQTTVGQRNDQNINI